MERVCVLIPAYNEAKAIGDIIRRVRGFGLDVVVIDDGSADATPKLAEEAGAVVLKHGYNKGKGASLREGIRYILSGPYHGIIIMDGDGQHNPAEINQFLAKGREGSSFIIGNRMQDTESMPWVRYYTNKIMSAIISFICKQRIPDTQCGYKMIKREVLEKLNLGSSRYDIETEILFEAAHMGVKIDSIPVKTIYRKEESYISPIKDTLRFLHLLVNKVIRREDG